MKKKNKKINETVDKPTESERTRDKQTREKDELKRRHEAELQKARERDFRAKEAENRKKRSEVNEYLEDGTDELVAAYKRAVPGQISEQSRPENLERAIKSKVNSDIRKQKLDGRGRFNSLLHAYNILDKILESHGLKVTDTFINVSRAFQGDSDFVGDQNSTRLTIERSISSIKIKNSLLVISWEHLSSGYEFMCYLS